LHALLDFGFGEGAVVDADFVDDAVEGLAPDVVPANAQRAGGSVDG
jgi:hypothetical protein